jgi:hypothetical protein
VALEAALAVPVYDYVPETAAMPYVTFGPTIETPFDAHDHIGYRLVFEVNVWTRDEPGGARGAKTGLTIASQIDAALNHVDLTTADADVFHVWVSSTDSMGDPDPQIRRIRKECRTFLQR